MTDDVFGDATEKGALQRPEAPAPDYNGIRVEPLGEVDDLPRRVTRPAV